MIIDKDDRREYHQSLNITNNHIHLNTKEKSISDSLFLKIIGFLIGTAITFSLGIYQPEIKNYFSPEHSHIKVLKNNSK